MEPQRLIRLQPRRPNDPRMILCNNLLRRRSAQKVQIETAADGAINDPIVPQQPVLPVSVPRIHAMGRRRRRRVAFLIPVPSLDVHGMRIMPVDIDFLVVVEIVRVPEGLGPVVAQTKPVDTGCQAVDVVVWHHVRYAFEELVFENDLVPVSIEDDFSGSHARDAELEAGVVCPFEG